MFNWSVQVKAEAMHQAVSQYVQLAIQVKADVTHQATHKKRGSYVQSACKKKGEFVPNTLS
jgi:hypothetical protein